jgi:L,D-peptidoglycan transpeptidase YkuD (ErfK/YbiS/YcfS/YnhG family)
MGGLVAGCATPTDAATQITVAAAPGSTTGTLSCQGRTYACMLGRSGIVTDKHEGDGATPAGLFLLREARYRTDRLTTSPITRLPLVPTRPSDGWCDDAADPAYNRLVTRPYPASTETLWRADEAYDVLAVIGYNDAPPVPGAGSAIFLHVMRQQAGHPIATAGCISLARDDLLAVLALCGPQTSIRIGTL